MTAIVKQSTLTGNQMHLCLLKVEGTLTNSQIAHRLGISEATVYRWLKDPDLSRTIEQMTDEIVRESRGQLKRFALQIVGTAISIALGRDMSGHMDVTIHLNENDRKSLETQRKMIEYLLPYILGDPKQNAGQEEPRTLSIEYVVLPEEEQKKLDTAKGEGL